MNREIQTEGEGRSSVAMAATESSSTMTQQSIVTTTLHQASIVRWLSLGDLLESIKKSCESLRIVLAQHKEEHRIEKINMSIVQQLIEFLQPWKYILTEVQKGNAPSLFAVLPCITFLKEDLINREKKEKQGN